MLLVYFERYILLSLYSCLKYGSFRSLIKRIASPVDFISGPSSLFTPGNLSKLNTGSLMAYPLRFFTKLKSFNLLFPQHDFCRYIEIRNLISFGDKRSCPGCPRIGFDHIHFSVFDRKLYIDQSPDI